MKTVGSYLTERRIRLLLEQHSLSLHKLNETVFDVDARLKKVETSVKP